MRAQVAMRLINNGNRTESSLIRSVIRLIIPAINEITSMITDRIGQHEVLLPVNHICNKFEKEKGENVSNKE